MSVFLDDGSRVSNCIHQGVGETLPLTEYRTAVFHHTNTPKWHETVKIVLDPAILLRAQIRFQFFHVSSTGNGKEQFATANFNLVSGTAGVIQRDDSYKVSLYKFEGSTASTSKKAAAPAVAAGLSPLQKELVVRTMLTSTCFEQHDQVSTIIHFRSSPDHAVNQALQIFLSAPPHPRTVLPFLPQFLDALFGIMERCVIFQFASL